MEKCFYCDATFVRDLDWLIHIDNCAAKPVPRPPSVTPSHTGQGLDAGSDQKQGKVT